MEGFPFASLRDEEQTSIAMKYEQSSQKWPRSMSSVYRHQGGQASHSDEVETGRRASKDILTAWHSPHYYAERATGEKIQLQSVCRTCVGVLGASAV